MTPTRPARVVRRSAALACLLAAAAVGTGCDEKDDDGPPATARAFAYVAAEYVGVPDYATSNDFPYFVQFKGDFVEAVLRTQVGNPDPGDALRVAVGTKFEGRDPTSCDDDEPYPYCEPLDGGGAMTWTLEDPEEDPGYVMVAVRKGDATVVVVFSGPHIVGDPRTMKLPVTVDQLVDIARDDRIGLTTTQAAVEAGEALTYWEETAPPPG